MYDRDPCPGWDYDPTRDPEKIAIAYAEQADIEEFLNWAEGHGVEDPWTAPALLSYFAQYQWTQCGKTDRATIDTLTYHARGVSSRDIIRAISQKHIPETH